MESLGGENELVVGPKDHEQSGKKEDPHGRVGRHLGSGSFDFKRSLSFEPCLSRGDRATQFKNVRITVRTHRRGDRRTRRR